jgi:hypothetical protein
VLSLLHAGLLFALFYTTYEHTPFRKGEFNKTQRYAYWIYVYTAERVCTFPEWLLPGNYNNKQKRKQ